MQTSTFSDENPRGFGLMQRDRDFNHYQDDGVFYDKRPSVWVEPKGNWGKGEVGLVEIPTVDETFDNIVTFWQPKEPLQAGQERLFSYCLTWGRWARRARRWPLPWRRVPASAASSVSRASAFLGGLPSIFRARRSPGCHAAPWWSRSSLRREVA